MFHRFEEKKYCFCWPERSFKLLIFNQLFLRLVQALVAKHSADSVYAECYPGVGNSCPCYARASARVRYLQRSEV